MKQTTTINPEDIKNSAINEFDLWALDYDTELLIYFSISQLMKSRKM